MSTQKEKRFAELYEVRGDGFAVLRPSVLRNDTDFVRRLRQMRKIIVIEQPSSWQREG